MHERSHSVAPAAIADGRALEVDVVGVVTDLLHDHGDVDAGIRLPSDIKVVAGVPATMPKSHARIIALEVGKLEKGALGEEGNQELVGLLGGAVIRVQAQLGRAVREPDTGTGSTRQIKVYTANIPFGLLQEDDAVLEAPVPRVVDEVGHVVGHVDEGLVTGGDLAQLSQL